MAEKKFTPTSLGLVYVIPSPSSSKDESELTPLLVVNNAQPHQAKKIMDHTFLESQKEPLLQELSLQEQHELKRK